MEKKKIEEILSQEKEIIKDVLDILKNNLYDCNDHSEINTLLNQLLDYDIVYPEIASLTKNDFILILKNMKQEGFIEICNHDSENFGIKILDKSDSLIDEIEKHEEELISKREDIVNPKYLKQRLDSIRANTSWFASTIDVTYPGYIILNALRGKTHPRKKFGFRLKVHYWDNREEYGRYE